MLRKAGKGGLAQQSVGQGLLYSTYTDGNVNKIGHQWRMVSLCYCFFMNSALSD